MSALVANEQRQIVYSSSWFDKLTTNGAVTLSLALPLKGEGTEVRFAGTTNWIPALRQAQDENDGERGLRSSPLKHRRKKPITPLFMRQQP